MAARNTTTGTILEQTIIPALEGNGYKTQRLANLGVSVTGGKHIVDVLVTRPDSSQIPISMKWQQSSGTAEEKVPFEVIKMIHAVKNSDGLFPYAYIVLAGGGWSKREFYLRSGLALYILDYDLVKLVTLEGLITLANKKKV